MPSAVNSKFLLLYGSQTGQAKAIAEEIADRSVHHKLNAEIYCLSETEKKFNIDKETCVVFVISTTGEGDPPDTAAKFVRRLKKKTLPDDYLSKLHYTLLGLGDSNYTNFCNGGKSLNRRLLELGAKQFYNPGFADDGVGLEVVVDPWLDGLMEPLKNQLSELSLIDCTNSCEDNSIPNTNTHKIDEMSAPNENNCATSIPFLNDVSSTNTSDNTDSSTVKNQSAINNGHTESASNSATSSDNTDSNTENIEPCLTSSRPPLSCAGLTLPLLPPPYIEVQFCEDKTINVDELPRQNGCEFPSSASQVKMAPITSASILTSSDAVKKTLKLTLNIEKTDITYGPGDSISVICPNDEDEVTKLLKRLNILDKSDMLVNLSIIPDTKKRRAVVPLYIPEQSTLRHIFTTCIDIREPPKKALLRVFVEYTSISQEKRRLQELCSKQGSEDYGVYIREPTLSILDILTAFPLCQPPVSSIIEHTSRLKPRPYSACSAQCVDKNRLEFVFNVIEIESGNGRVEARRGVCTGWLDDITKSIQQTRSDSLEDRLSEMTLNNKILIPIFSRTNQYFRPPSEVTCPVMFIGPGTGVAPFIGFLSYRDEQRRNLTADKQYGETWLFYGCRNQQKDYLFQQELKTFKESGTLSRLCVSFSRDVQPEGSPRYVQDYLMKEIDSMYDILETETSLIYVCGDAKNMAKNVNQAFIDILKIKKGLSEEDGRAYMMKLRIHRRYFEDVWT